MGGWEAHQQGAPDPFFAGGRPSADREAAIREWREQPENAGLLDADEVRWLQAELAAAREREEKLREALRIATDALANVDVSSGVPAYVRRNIAAHLAEIAALADGEDET